MNSRDAILGSVRANEPRGDYPLPALPMFPIDDGGDLVALFLRNLTSMGGRGYQDGNIDSLVQERAARIVASAVPEYAGNCDLTLATRPRELAHVDVAIVRARFGVAETGSVLLTNEGLVVNAVAYLAQHLIILLDAAEIVATLQDAYYRPDFQHQRYASFHTGPSATADIEGVLIHGAQGVRSLTVLLTKEAAVGQASSTGLRA